MGITEKCPHEHYVGDGLYCDQCDKDSCLTENQREMMMHALGSSRLLLGFRNYYSAVSKDFQDWDDLVKRGLAKRFPKDPRDKNTYYRVTDRGIWALGYDPSILTKPIKLPRG